MDKATWIPAVDDVASDVTGLALDWMGREGQTIQSQPWAWSNRATDASEQLSRFLAGLDECLVADLLDGLPQRFTKRLDGGAFDLPRIRVAEDLARLGANSTILLDAQLVKLSVDLSNRCIIDAWLPSQSIGRWHDLSITVAVPRDFMLATYLAFRAARSGPLRVSAGALLSCSLEDLAALSGNDAPAFAALAHKACPTAPLEALLSSSAEIRPQSALPLRA